MNNDTPIVLKNVSKSFDGQAVVKDLNLAVKAGGIYGFIGRNGAGKTTTLRMLAGLTKPHTGEVRIWGSDPFGIGAEERQWLGYMPEKPGIPAFASACNMLKLGQGLYPNWNNALAESLLSKFNLAPRKRFSNLSQGSQRLLGFIMAIAPRPKVLLLDEPAANLDVVARREILDDILTLIRDCDCTVLISTHILGDVERVADEIGILAHGKLQVSEPLDTLKDSIRQVRFYGFKNGLPAEGLPKSFRTVQDKNELTVTLRTNPAITPEKLAERWCCQYEVRTLGLEDIFVELSRN